jgi:hypothetical protein
MGDQSKIVVLQKQISDLRNKRSQLIEGRSRQTRHTLLEIDRALQSRGWFTVSSSPVLLPREYDPDSELRDLDDQITDLSRVLVGEEEKL